MSVAPTGRARINKRLIAYTDRNSSYILCRIGGSANSPTKIIEMMPAASKILRVESLALPRYAYAQDDRLVYRSLF